MSQLEQFSKLTEVVADTGEVEQIKQFKPVDATTNPSLIVAASKDPTYAALVDDAVEFGKKSGGTREEQISATLDKLAVNFGTEITKIVPGVVSTEVDARLSFDIEATIAKARRLIALYEDAGVSKDRVLIKIASTWEGIQAAKVLQAEGINCNMTLLFCMAQAVACADVGAFLISPFVGRITDWYKAKTGTANYESEEDPGVISVRNIYKYYKNFGHKTVVMGASFRNKGQILALSGCDKLTISPTLLKEMQNSTDEVKQHLFADHKDESIEKLSFNEAQFRYALNADAMATEKLAEGIRKFAEAGEELEQIIASKLG